MSTKPSVVDQVLELLWYVPVYFAIKWFGWVFGIAGLILVFYVIGKILGKWFGLQFASGMDTYWLCDDERNYCNIIGFIRIEKFKAQEVKNQLFEKTTQFTRNRSKLVKFLGTWWYKEIPMEDMIKQKEKLIQLRYGIHNEKQLAEFMAKEQSIRDPIDNV